MLKDALAPTLESALRGDWSYKRLIEDHLLKVQGFAAGSVSFRPHLSAHTLLYRERGHIRFANYKGFCKQDYLFTFNFRAPSGAEVQFTDGRYFHSLDLSTGHCEVLHRCGRDVYKGHYSLINFQCLEIRWYVQGPRKNYTLLTRLEKQATVAYM